MYATVGPDDVIDKSIIWTSSDTRVATVDKHGLVTMVGEGTAVITARTQAGGLEASCTVSSQSPVAQAQLTPDSEDDPSLAGEKDTPHSSREEQEELSPQENTSSGLGEKPPLASSSEPESNSDRYRYLIKRELADPTLAEQDSSYQGADSQAEMEISADYLPLAMEQRRLKSHILPIFIILFLSGALREYWQYKKEAIS